MDNSVISIKKQVKDTFFSANDIQLADGDDINFAGAVYRDDVWEILSEHWSKKGKTETCKQYLAKMNTYIFSVMPDKPLRKIKKEDVEVIVKKMRIARGNLGKETTIEYIRNLEYLFSKVIESASKVGLCEDVFWGSRYKIPNVADSKHSVKIGRIPKSLSPSQEIACEGELLRESLQIGEKMGLAMMFCDGTRENEACGALFESIKPFECDPTKYKLIIYQTAKKNTRTTKLGGKTSNSVRTLPIPDKLAKLILERKRALIEIYKDEKVVNKLPIVCVGNNYEKPCTPSELSIYGSKFLRSIEFKESDLQELDLYLDNIISSGEADKDSIERDPTTYLFRRNFATRLFQLGLSQSEREYLMGHTIVDDDDIRNHFSNEDVLIKITEKLSARPLVNDVNYICEKTLENKVLRLNNTVNAKVSIPVTNKSRIRVEVAERENFSQTKIRISGTEGLAFRGEYDCSVNENEYSAETNINAKYWDVITRYQSKV